MNFIQEENLKREREFCLKLILYVPFGAFTYVILNF